MTEHKLTVTELPTCKLLQPKHWIDYELIDTGEFEKLERFGKYIIRRPEPQALWNKTLSPLEWEKMADATFKKEIGKNIPADSEQGNWKQKKNMPQQWWITYAYNQMTLHFRLGLTAFKHLGIFPEQAANWDFIYDRLLTDAPANAQVLNLFAYTGGASLAAKAAGAEVTHVDAVRQVIHWSKANMEASKMAGIRWVIEDVTKYLRRQAKRGKQYDAIILDPPAYGRGPEGEKWILEQNIAEVMQLCRQILSPNNGLILLNLYSMGFSELVANNIIRQYFPKINAECGELVIADRAGRPLPLSVFMRGTITQTQKT